ncbi:MAG: HAD family hydrolase [Myxococcota bacterium]|jgi:HAD superfamily phosphoserine phosphatase-like hydrolase|nr:HAD family hydrolase [Myxococcota bacterium]
MSEFNLPLREPAKLPDFVSALPHDGEHALAIFDADGTLWRNDVADDFTTWMIRSGRIDGSRWSEYLQIYRDDHAAGCRFLLSLYTGLTQAQLHEGIWYWWRELAQRAWVVEVLEAMYWLAEHRYRIWVVTGSPTDTMLPLKDFLPVDEVVGMDFELDPTGRITGKHAGISCADAGKAEKVKLLWGERPILFSAGNGKLDTAMIMLSTGVRWSVYPNPSFHELSQAQGWHILPRPADFIEESKLA